MSEPRRRNRFPAGLRILVPAAVSCTVGCAGAGRDVSASGPDAALHQAHAESIARIESGLRPTVQVRGRDYASHTITQRMEQLGVPAVSVAVISGGRIAWAKAYGVADATTGDAVTTETLFQAASMSKPVTALGVLALVQEGRLTLDEDVNRWLRRWRIPGHQWQADHPVTLRRLLSHTAGLTVSGFPGYAAGAEIPTVEQVLAGVPPANTPAVTVATRPGEAWRYSGGGLVVVQLLVEEVAGVPFALYMRDRVLRPLGMTASTYEQPLPAAPAARAATGHRAAAQPVPGRYNAYPEMAAAGLWTTPTELARWIVNVQQSLQGDPAGLLQPAMARAMVTIELNGPHGLGPLVEGEGATQRFSHNGVNEGFRGVFFGFTQRGDGIVIMTNADAGMMVANELVIAVAAEYGWPGLAPTEIVPVAVPADTLKSYEGVYGAPEQPLRLTITAVGDVLMVVTGQGPQREFLPVGPDRFQGAVGGGLAVFERDDTGGVVAVRVSGMRLPRQ